MLIYAHLNEQNNHYIKINKLKKKKKKVEQYEREGKINGKNLIEHLNDLIVDI